MYQYLDAENDNSAMQPMLTLMISLHFLLQQQTWCHHRQTFQWTLQTLTASIFQWWRRRGHLFLRRRCFKQQTITMMIWEKYKKYLSQIYQDLQQFSLIKQISKMNSNNLFQTSLHAITTQIIIIISITSINKGKSIIHKKKSMAKGKVQ